MLDRDASARRARRDGVHLPGVGVHRHGHHALPASRRAARSPATASESQSVRARVGSRVDATMPTGSSLTGTSASRSAASSSPSCRRRARCVTSIVPPFSSTFRLAIVSPRPVPVAFVEKYGSKISRERFLIHADAGVGDLDDHDAWPCGRARGVVIVSRPLAGHRVQRVLDDVGQRAREQRAIDRSPAAGRAGASTSIAIRPASPARYGATTSSMSAGSVGRLRAAASATRRSSRTRPRSAAAAAPA